MKQITLTAEEATALSSILTKLNNNTVFLPTKSKQIKKLSKTQKLLESFENQLSKKFR
jgi:hypothetical protein